MKNIRNILKIDLIKYRILMYNNTISNIIKLVLYIFEKVT